MHVEERQRAASRERADAIGEPTRPGLLGWRVLTVAAITAVTGRLVGASSGLPGYGAALFALAVPFAVGAWAFHMVGSRRPSVRRDVFLGVAVGAMVCAIVGLLW